MDKFITVDIELLKEDVPADFNIYVHLPLNKKFIHFMKENDVIDRSRLERCKYLGFKKLWVPIEELHRFNNYVRRYCGLLLENVDVVTFDNNMREFETEHFKLNDNSELVESLGLMDKEERTALGEAFDELSDLNEEEKQAFYDEEAEAILDIMNDQMLSNEEKAHEIKMKAKEMLEEVFHSTDGNLEDDPERSPMINHCKNIVSSLIKLSSSDSNLYDNILKFKEAKGDVYDHSIYTSTYAVMFAMGLGFYDQTTIADIGMGALLHDLGITRLSDPTLMDREDCLNPHELAVYKDHCFYALEILEETNSQVNDIVQNIILMHHEHHDGSGFPGGIKGRRIPDYVYITAIADRYDMLTYRGVHPLMALQRMRDENTRIHATSVNRYKPLIFSKIMNLMNIDERLDELQNETHSRQMEAKSAA